jgi:magnesium transporter
VAQVNPPVTVDALMDQEEVARLIRRHDLLAIPVVDAQQQMLGIVTVDDVLDALIEESTEDAHKFGGMERWTSRTCRSASSRCCASAPAG